MKSSDVKQIPVSGFDSVFWMKKASSKVQEEGVAEALSLCKGAKIGKDGLPKTGAKFADVEKVFNKLEKALKKAKTKANNSKPKPKDTLLAIEAYLKRIVEGRAFVEHFKNIKEAEEHTEMRKKAIIYAAKEQKNFQAWEKDIKAGLKRADNLLKAAKQAYGANTAPIEKRAKIITATIQQAGSLRKKGKETAKKAEDLYKQIWDGKGIVMKARTDYSSKDSLPPSMKSKWNNESNKLFGQLNDITSNINSLRKQINGDVPSFDVAVDQIELLDLVAPDLAKLRKKTIDKLDEAQGAVDKASKRMTTLAEKMEKQHKVEIPKALKRMEDAPAAVKKSLEQRMTFSNNDYAEAETLFKNIQAQVQRSMAIPPQIAEEPEIKARSTGITDEADEAADAYNELQLSFEAFEKGYKVVMKKLA